MMKLEDIDIAKILPQSWPFVMIDGIKEYAPARNLTAVKNVTADEWACSFLSSSEPFYPEVLLIEGAAQTAIVFSALENDRGSSGSRQVALGKIKAEFYDPVRIGDCVEFTTMNFKVMRGRGYVDVDVIRRDGRIGEVSIFYSFEMEGEIDSTK